MIRNIIFDFDGTLVDSSSAISKLYSYFAKKYNISKLDKEGFEAIKTLPLKQKMRKLGVPMRKLISMSVEAKNVYSSFISEIKFKEGIPCILSELADRRINMFILSSNSVSNINKFLKLNGISFFKGIYSSSNILKKDLTIIKLLKKHNLSKDEILYVGDEVRDIIACKRIGVKIAAVSWGFDSADSLSDSNPDYLFNKPSDLSSCLTS
ncbi:MAG: HAD-IA family hydrolase [Actinomycetota bacterium]|nr:HAD-IA family hydrolase [Actinomycetota bacterium]